MVYHVLKDGTQISDITGHVVKVSDAEPLYRYLQTINDTEFKRSYTYEVKK